MAIADRLVSLERKHKNLHDRVEAAEAEKAPDKYISNMKREKLVLKDEITRLRKEVIEQFK